MFLTCDHATVGNTFRELGLVWGTWEQALFYE